MSEPPNSRPQTNGLISWLKPEELSQWDDFVLNHPLGSPYHLSAWTVAMEKAFPHTKGGVAVLRESTGHKIVAGIPVFAVRSWILGNRLVSVPFASTFDPLVARPKDLEHLRSAILALQKTSRSRFWELRTLRGTGFLQSLEMKPSQQFWHHYLDLRPDLPSLLSSFHETSIRQTIKKAEKAGVKVTRAAGAEAVRAFHDVVTQTRKRLGLPAIPLVFFQSIVQSFGANAARIYLAWLGSEVIAAILVLQDQRTCMLEYAGDTAVHRNTGANQLLCWEAIMQARAEGCSEFSFGRTSFANPGLRNYKLRWNTVEETISCYRYPSSYPKRTSFARAALLHRFAKALIRSMPKGLHLSMTRFLYRHWG